MRWVFGLLAAASLGAGTPPASDNAMLAYEFKVLEMNGVDWRAALHAKLHPVASRGSSTVWTAPKAAGADLVAKAGTVLAAPRLIADVQASATVRHVEAMGAADAAVARAAYFDGAVPTNPQAPGYSIQIAGRKLDQGVLATLKIEDRQVTAVHKVRLDEACDAKGKEGACCEASSTEIAIPECVRCEVAGEWLIPNDEMLVVSLGAHTMADPEGKAVVRERLVVLTAKASEAPSKPRMEVEQAKKTLHMKLQALRGNDPFAGRDFADIVTRVEESPRGRVAVVIPAPMVPSRHLPDAVDPDGNVIPLPPLPGDAPPPTTHGESAEPCASPQVKKAAPTPTAEPMPIKPANVPDRPRDADSNKAGYTPAACPACGADKSADKSVEKSSWTPVGPKPLSFRLPLNGNVVLEVKATATPIFAAPAPPEAPKGGVKAN